MAATFSRTHYLLLGLLILGAALRFFHLDFQSPWLDEINTLNDADPAFSLGEVHASVAKYDLHPPLYFFVIHLLFKIFGYTIFVARFFSAVIGIAAIYAIYGLARELFNKQVGIIAALMLCVNGFHIYYSQEARPYAMFCLFTICSFLYLVRFIKLPTRRNAIFYGVFTALMLYGHLFGFFTLVGQMALIVFFIAVSKKDDRKPFVANSIIAGIVAFVLFAPSAKIVYAALVVKEFWISAPSADVFAKMLGAFFSHSEIILGFAGLFAVLYFIGLAKQKNEALTRENILANKAVFGGIALMCWIAFTILLPLIKSYLSFPVIIDRYFINLLPAVIIVLAVGLCRFRNQLVLMVFVCLFFVFSMTDLLIVRKYYTTVTKTQFRELTPLINSHDSGNEPIVTSLAWHFGYFLNNDKNRHTIIDANLDRFVGAMMADATKVKPFWYVDAHDRPYRVTAKTQQFLDAHFNLTDKLEKHDIWTRHYEPKEMSNQPIIRQPQNPIK